MNNQPELLPSPVKQATKMRKTVSVRLIGPSEAKAYLERNAANQRPLRNSDLNRYANDMIKGEWIDDVSAITFDANGNLTNGQHRLHAVIKSETVQSFIIGENWPIEAMATMDQGNKRSQLDRICVGGVDMLKGSDSVVRHSMTTWTANQAGGTIYNRRESDHRVVRLYQRHSEFVDLLVSKYKSAATCSPLVLGAALYGYAQACTSVQKGSLQCDPYERVIRFLDILAEGPVMESYNPGTDSQAVILRDWLTTMKLQNRRPVDGQTFRIVTTCLGRFLRGKAIKNVVRTGECPWGPMESLPGTN
jgi:hypothetical protein